MQTAIDRVIRTLTFNWSAATEEKAWSGFAGLSAPATAPAPDADILATKLLQNYRGYVAGRADVAE